MLLLAQLISFLAKSLCWDCAFICRHPFLGTVLLSETNCPSPLWLSHWLCKHQQVLMLPPLWVKDSDWEWEQIFFSACKINQNWFSIRQYWIFFFFPEEEMRPNSCLLWGTKRDSFRPRESIHYQQLRVCAKPELSPSTRFLPFPCRAARGAPADPPGRGGAGSRRHSLAAAGAAPQTAPVVPAPGEGQLGPGVPCFSPQGKERDTKTGSHLRF